MLRRRSEDTAALLTRGSGWREAKHFLDVLPDTHGAQYVQEYERALRVIIARQISVRQALYPADRDERQSGDHSPVEYVVEHAQERREREPDREHRLHLHEGQVPIVVLQPLLLPFDLLLLLPVQRVAVCLFPFLQLLALLLDLGLQLLILLSSVDHQPRQPFAQQRRAYADK